MRDLGKLIRDCRIKSWVSVAVHITPHAGRAIDVTITLSIKQVDTFTTFNKEWFVFRHLSKGVPYVIFIPRV
jgi:hypothetical protein